LNPSSVHSHGAFRPAHGALLGLLIVLTLLHLFVIEKQPDPMLWGDEPQYQEFAYLDAIGHDTSLRPGSLRFDHRPELNSRVYGVLYSRGWREVRAVAGFQLLLFLAVVAFTFFQARALGLGDAAALTSAALLGFCPWFGFHVHSLWPEVLHAFLFGGALFFLLAYLRRFDWHWLPASALFLAYALFAKGVLVPFVPLIVIYLAVATFFGFPESSTRARWLRALATAGGYLALVSAIVAPQVIDNARAGHGWRLAANRWWNLELGLTLPVDAGLPVDKPDGLQAWRHHQQASLQYLMAASTLGEREELARERTLAFLGETGTASLIGRQFRKLCGLFLRGESSFEQSLTYRRRWGETPPLWMRLLRLPARLMWYALLILALAGLVLVVARLAGREKDSEWPGAGWAFLTLFLGGFLLALLAVPIKVRVVMPLVPVLCLFAGMVVQRLYDRKRAASLV
jgi:hypothetical protein